MQLFVSCALLNTKSSSSAKKGREVTVAKTGEKKPTSQQHRYSHLDGLNQI